MAAGGTIDAPETVTRLRRTFESGHTRDIAWRRGQLEALRRLLLEGEARLIAAIQADFRKPAFETQITETRNVVWEIDHALPRLARWMRGHRASIKLRWIDKLMYKVFGAGHHGSLSNPSPNPFKPIGMPMPSSGVWKMMKVAC